MTTNPFADLHTEEVIRFASLMDAAGVGGYDRVDRL